MLPYRRRKYLYETIGINSIGYVTGIDNDSELADIIFLLLTKHQTRDNGMYNLSETYVRYSRSAGYIDMTFSLALTRNFEFTCRFKEKDVLPCYGLLQHLSNQSLRKLSRLLSKEGEDQLADAIASKIGRIDESSSKLLDFVISPKLAQEILDYVSDDYNNGFVVLKQTPGRIMINKRSYDVDLSAQFTNGFTIHTECSTKRLISHLENLLR